MSSGTSLQAGAAVKSQGSAARWMPDSWHHPLCLAALLLGATILVYSPLSGYEFINYDDQLYVTGNLMVQQGLTWQGTKWAFTTFTASNWHPLTWLSHMLDVELFGLNPVAHHYVSVVLHALNAITVFLLLYFATRATVRSFIVGALFAVHPLSVQSVMWIAERKNLICTLFFLLAIGGYGWYARRPNWRRYLCVLLLFCLALLAKPMVVTFPFVLLLLDYWPLRRWEALASIMGTGGKAAWLLSLLQLTAEKLPFFLVAIGDSVLTLVIQQRDAAVTANYLPLWVRVANAVLSYGVYLWKTIWPTSLCIFYPHPKSMLPWGKVALALVVIVTTTVVVLRPRSRPYAPVGWFWFLGILVPAIGLIQAGSQGMADRYVYIPYIGIFLVLVWSTADILTRVRIPTPVVALCVSCLLAALCWDTRVQRSYWRNSIVLFSHALDVTQNNSVAHLNLAAALADQGNGDAALWHFQAALAINPSDAVALEDLGLYHFHHGNVAQAVEELNKAAQLARYPALLENIHMRLGMLYSNLGDMEKSKSEYREAIKYNPGDWQPYVNLAVHLYLEKNYDEALNNLAISISVFPNSTAYYYQGQTLQAEGRLQEAIESYRKALQISPHYKDAQSALSAVLMQIQSARPN